MAGNALQTAVRRLRTQLAVDQHNGFSDRQLLERFLHQHDESAFTALVRRHERLVHAALAKVLTNPADIEDAFQATFLVLVRKAKSVTWQAGLGSWLYAVAHRVAVHARAALRKRVLREEEAAARAATTAAPPDLSWREACALLHEELDRLPDKFRLPLLLCYLEGKSRDEAAAQLGLTPATVKGRLERGRDRLRGRLTRRGVALSAGLLAALTHSPARAFSPRLAETTLAAATGLVPARVAGLVQGVTTLMILSKMKFLAGMLLVAGLVGALLGARTPAAPAPGADEAAPQTSAQSTPLAADNNDEPKPVEVAGRVLDPADRPVRGARLFVWTNALQAGAARKPQALTDDDGRFRFRVPPAAPGQEPKLVAAAAGFAPDWASLGAQPEQEFTLKLRADDVPLTGRVLNLEGKPVEGVTAEVLWVGQHPQDKVADWIAHFVAQNAKGYWINEGGLRLIRPQALGVTPSVVTDRDGWFRLHGVGRDRVVTVLLRGTKTETHRLQVVARDGPKAGWVKGDYGLYATGFELVVAPGKPVVGTVREKGTGKPLAGVTVAAEKFHWTAKTDAAGRYRIDGVAKQDKYLVAAGGPTHFNCTKLNVADTPGLEPVAVDFELERGVVLRGRLTDKATGEPVRGDVLYYAAVDNPNLKDFSDLAKGQMLVTRLGEAGADGSFTVLGIPGLGALSVKARDANRFLQSEPARVNLGDRLPDYHALVAVHVDENDPKSTQYDIALEPSRVRSGTVVGPDGQPLAGACFAGLSPVVQTRAANADRMETATFTVGGLDPRRPRSVVFLYPEKKLAKVQPVRGDEEGPLTVRLEPVGAAAGRVLDTAGKPAAGLAVTALVSRKREDNDLPEEMRFVMWNKYTTVTATTDEQGRFRLDGLVPGLKYLLNVRVGENVVYSGYCPTVESGKTQEMGDLKSASKP